MTQPNTQTPRPKGAAGGKVTPPKASPLSTFRAGGLHGLAEEVHRPSGSQHQRLPCLRRSSSPGISLAWGGEEGACVSTAVCSPCPPPPEKGPPQPTNSRLLCRPASQWVPHGSWAEGTQAEAVQWK